MEHRFNFLYNILLKIMCILNLFFIVFLWKVPYNLQMAKLVFVDASTSFIYLFKKIFILTWGHFFIAFGERGRERERETLMWERNIDWLLSWTHPDRGLNLQPGYVPWAAIECANFQSTGWYSNQLSHTVQGQFHLLKSAKFHIAIKIYQTFSEYVISKYFYSVK